MFIFDLPTIFLRIQFPVFYLKNNKKTMGIVNLKADILLSGDPAFEMVKTRWRTHQQQHWPLQVIPKKAPLCFPKLDYLKKKIYSIHYR